MKSGGCGDSGGCGGQDDLNKTPKWKMNLTLHYPPLLAFLSTCPFIHNLLQAGRRTGADATARIGDGAGAGGVASSALGASGFGGAMPQSIISGASHFCGPYWRDQASRASASGGKVQPLPEALRYLVADRADGVFIDKKVAERGVG